MLQNSANNYHVVNGEMPDHIAKEFQVDSHTGYGFVSLRGLGRLSGTRYQSWGQRDSIFTKKVDEYLTGKGFECDSFLVNGRVPDTVASLVIKYYAYQGNEIAQKTDEALGAIGLRTFIQKTLDWKPPVTLTEKEIIALFVLPVAAPYSPKFEVEFYNQLSRLTGLKQQGHLRPHYWAQLTKELVYDYMPSGVYDEIKRWQRSTDPDKKTKVHQYMSEVGSETLINHLKHLLILMSAASSLSELKRSLNQSITKNYLPTFWEVK